LESQISLAALIHGSTTQTTLKGHLGGLPTGTSYWMNYVLKSFKVLGFTQKHRAAKQLPTWQVMDVLPKQKVLNVLTALTHSFCFI